MTQGKSGEKAKLAKQAQSLERVVCRNRRARHDYEILDEIECGVVLVGSEVKSIRDNKISIEESFARYEKGEVWLFNCDIGEYPQASYLNHARHRPRKLLMKKKEICKFAEAAKNSGQTLIPLTVHFVRGFVKINLAIAKGRQEYDKRQKLKQADADRSMREAKKKLLRPQH